LKAKLSAFQLSAVLLGASSGLLYLKTHKISTTRPTANPQVILASEEHRIFPPHYPWYHEAPWRTIDHHSARRGFEVYKQVCSACHRLDLRYISLVNVTHTKREALELAREVEIEDGPNDDGEMFTRPGRLTDKFPLPYPNAKAAAAANNGVEPPDLTEQVEAHSEKENYIFSLLTGYRNPPAGIVAPSNAVHYNPYFDGAWISMAQALTNGLVEYEDGTEATISQMAKDVTTFLSFAACPELNDRHRMGLKTLFFLVVLTIPGFYAKRLVWSTIKNSKIRFVRKR